MFDLLTKFPGSLFGKEERPHAFRFNFIKDRQSICKTITACLQSGKLIGVYSRALGDGMFLAGIESLENEAHGKVVVFETYDLSGQVLNRTRLFLDEIKMVCPFDIKYVNPILGQVSNASAVN